MLLVGGGLAALFTGVFFAIKTWGDVNPRPFLSAASSLLLTYGLLISTAYMGSWLSERFGKPRRSEPLQLPPGGQRDEDGPLPARRVHLSR